ncbi:hypothetical protein H312_00646 [Anncaliia algerae PRA339]|uniref:Peptidase M48 domain-containing protein n=1 Tax=Anncaliia algerae PRA339 TaxID=1288291 RepID=A0A059F455_9MICR|nr:hypothetical protein H312_00646 [Anncaliia algerae PRA339]
MRLLIHSFAIIVLILHIFSFLLTMKDIYKHWKRKNTYYNILVGNIKYIILMYLFHRESINTLDILTERTEVLKNITDNFVYCVVYFLFWTNCENSLIPFLIIFLILLALSSKICVFLLMYSKNANLVIFIFFILFFIILNIYYSVVIFLFCYLKRKKDYKFNLSNTSIKENKLNNEENKLNNEEIKLINNENKLNNKIFLENQTNEEYLFKNNDLMHVKETIISVEKRNLVDNDVIQIKEDIYTLINNNFDFVCYEPNEKGINFATSYILNMKFLILAGDTSIFNADELYSIVMHEIGHGTLGQLLFYDFLDWMIYLSCFFVYCFIFNAFIKRDDLMNYKLIILLLNSYMFIYLYNIIINIFNRYLEIKADDYANENGQGNFLIDSFKKISEAERSPYYLNFLSSFLFSTHPSMHERVKNLTKNLNV